MQNIRLNEEDLLHKYRISIADVANYLGSSRRVAKKIVVGIRNDNKEFYTNTYGFGETCISPKHFINYLNVKLTNSEIDNLLCE